MDEVMRVWQDISRRLPSASQEECFHQTPAIQNYKKINFFCLNSIVYNILLWSHGLIHTPPSLQIPLPLFFSKIFKISIPLQLMYSVIFISGVPYCDSVLLLCSFFIYLSSLIAHFSTCISLFGKDSKNYISASPLLCLNLKLFYWHFKSNMFTPKSFLPSDSMETMVQQPN